MLTPEKIKLLEEASGLSASQPQETTGSSRAAEIRALAQKAKPSIRQSFTEALLTPKQETPMSDFMGANVAQTAVDYGTEMVKNPLETAKGVAKGVPGGAAQFTKLIDTGINKALGKEGTTLDYGPVEELTQPSNKAQEGGYVVGTALPVERAVTAATPLVKAGVEAVGGLTKTALDHAQSLPGDFGKKVVDFISADPEKKVATILKESKPEELDNYLSVAEKAASDPRVATPFEEVGNKLSDTTKMLKSKLSQVGQAKSEILQPLREGLGSFREQTAPFIQKLNSLKNSFGEIDKGSVAKVNAIISDAKTIATKLDADKFIDKLQDMLYSGNIDMTIPRGSTLDKQLRNLVGEYNNSLKSSLPKEYAQLNEQYSKLIDSLDTVNRSLGEVVEGVPVRGASLIKQFFSPSGTKAKEIFEFIKKETNGEVDLAKDATLAKFAMDLFEDPRARSLLSGIGDIPTTVSGAISKVAEKVGGERLQDTMRESTIRKAKDITKPSFNEGAVPETVKTFEELTQKANQYQTDFKKSVENIANSLGFDVAVGNPKKLETLKQKALRPGETLTPETARDANRATILVNSSKDLSKVEEAVKKEFGNVTRVKDKFGNDYLYKSAIINVKTPLGHEVEVAVTTPGMWQKKITEGDKLYNIVRDKRAGWEEAEKRMEELYRGN